MSKYLHNCFGLLFCCAVLSAVALSAPGCGREPPDDDQRELMEDPDQGGGEGAGSEECQGICCGCEDPGDREACHVALEACQALPFGNAQELCMADFNGLYFPLCGN